VNALIRVTGIHADHKLLSSQPWLLLIIDPLPLPVWVRSTLHRHDEVMYEIINSDLLPLRPIIGRSHSIKPTITQRIERAPHGTRNNDRLPLHLVLLATFLWIKMALLLPAIQLLV
jgi:hypothetical protein